MRRLHRIFIAALASLCLLAPANASQSQWQETLLPYLTEMCGYTSQEAQTFVFEADETDEGVQVRFWSEAHPEWVYTAVLDENGKPLSWKTPFVRQGPDYLQGENALRTFLCEMDGRLDAWDAEARQALAERLKEWNFAADANLCRGLSTGRLSAAETVQGLFTSFFGSEFTWNEAVRQWRDDVMESHGLTLEPQQARTVEAYAYLFPRNGDDQKATVFGANVPDELETALTLPQLEGWTPLCGASMTVDGGVALVAMEKDGVRQLIALTAQEGSWTAQPVGTGAIKQTGDVIIEVDPQAVTFVLCYEEDGRSLRLHTRVRKLSDAGPVCLIESLEYTDASAGQITLVSAADVNLDEWYDAVTYLNGVQTRRVSYGILFPPYLEYVDMETFPMNDVALRSLTPLEIPAGYGVAGGVHLRQRTSSRSGDMGMYNAGTLVEILQELPGDPNPWFRVRIGQTEGYMSSMYVRYDDSACMTQPLRFNALPVAAALVPTDLKTNTGWFAGVVARLETGAKMHVLADCGDWLHVMLCDGEPGWLMDVHGVSGYLRKADVVQAGTSQQLDWLMAGK